jgi:sporulation-control protein
MFEKILSRIGIGGAKVDTIVIDNRVETGGILKGELHIFGGNTVQKVESMALELNVSYTSQEPCTQFPIRTVALVTYDVTGKYEIQPKEEKVIPFEISIPSHCPISFNTLEVNLNTRINIEDSVEIEDVDGLHVFNKTIEDGLETFEKSGFHHSEKSGGIIRREDEIIQVFELTDYKEKVALYFRIVDGEWKQQLIR